MTLGLVDGNQVCCQNRHPQTTGTLRGIQILRKCREMGGDREQEERHLGDIEKGLRKWQMESCRAGGAPGWAGRHRDQGLRPKDSRVSSSTAETLWLREQHLKKEGLKYRFAISPALKGTQDSISFFLPPLLFLHGHGMAQMGQIPAITRGTASLFLAVLLWLKTLGLSTR